MLIVINEWIFHDLWGQNGEHLQQETAQFLITLENTRDRFVIPNEFRWVNKANRLMEFTDARRRRISKVFRSLYDDLERVVKIRPEVAETTPRELRARLPEKDVYLVSAYLTANTDVLVTTDVPLHDSLAESEVSCQMRGDFLAEYLP